MYTILGANGTIGRDLAKELHLTTDKIRLVSRNPKKINSTDELFPADLRIESEVEKAIAGSTHVFLLVGFEYKLAVWQKEWPKLMTSTIRACKKHGAKLIFFDNVYSYDVQFQHKMTEETPINPASKKGVVRAQVAAQLLQAIEKKEISGMIVRAADFYGPGNERSAFVETVIKNQVKGGQPMWFGSADHIHSFTFTPDAAKATAQLAITESAYNQIWHLPTAKEKHTVRALAAMAGELCTNKKTIRVLSTGFIKFLGWFMPILKEMPEMMYQNERDYFFDSSKFEKAFGWTATSYQDGLKQTISFEKSKK